MYENTFSNVNRVDRVETQSPVESSSMVQAMLDKSRSQLNIQSGKVEQGTKPAPFAETNSDVTLKFKIDRETNDLTIFILNRATRQVVRTIPPDEISNLKPGDLLELFA